jgi:group II intron reverse transcriptase/maturase
MSRQLELPFAAEGEALQAKGSDEAPETTHAPKRSGASGLMEAVVDRENLKAALKRVRRNGGSPGSDGMTVGELPDYLRHSWGAIREQLLAGSYRPQPVLRRQIAKSDGGMRELGIPTVLDRFIQQALLQVLQPRFDPSFSDHSYGFRPGRRAHDAVRRAQRYISEGRRWVVDVDLERFFDRVHHDTLMGALSKRIADRRILRLIRRYLEAGVLADGVVIERVEGTPQGGPLSPLLANVLLDRVDKALEQRGNAFVRYADDCNVYVRSRRAGERMMAQLARLYGALRLRINEAKSAVAPARRRPFLGFAFWAGPNGVTKRRVADKALRKMKQRVRELTRRNGGASLPQVAAKLREYLLGWKAYFRLAETPNVFAELDGWIRHRLRALQLKQWKRGPTIYRELRARGASKDLAARVAGNARRWWRNSAMGLHIALPNRLFDELGVPRLAA